MKRVVGLFLVILLLIFSYGCGKNGQNNNEEGGYMVLEYHTYPADGSSEEMDNYPYVKIYSDRKIEWGYGNGEIVNYDSISKKLYDEIVSLAFSKKFTNLKEDISDEDVEEGDISYITIYYDDGTYKRIGGISPTNEVYLKLEEKMEEIYNKDH